MVEAESLRPKDRNGKADPYVKIGVGGRWRADSRKDFKAETLEPVFGQMFQIVVDLPLEKDLDVAVFDHDLIGSDELIGRELPDYQLTVETKNLHEYKTSFHHNFLNGARNSQLLRF